MRELRNAREMIETPEQAAEYIKRFCDGKQICGEIWVGIDPNSGVPTLDLILRAR